MVEIKTLEQTSTSAIAAAFNEAFSGYLVPLSMTPEQLEDKMKAEGIGLSLSAGVFAGDRLVGFILHANRSCDNAQLAYNAGTGVVPEFRGQRLTQQMYSYLLPLFRERKISTVQLEVIRANEKAAKVYRDLGFETVREFNCYKGAIGEGKRSPSFVISTMNELDEKGTQSFRDWTPSWQNSACSIRDTGENMVILGAYREHELAAYLALNQKTKRVHQFAVGHPYRREGAASALFQYVKDHYATEVSMINVDGNDTATNKFIQSVGLKLFVEQYEMKLVL